MVSITFWNYHFKLQSVALTFETEGALLKTSFSNLSEKHMLWIKKKTVSPHWTLPSFIIYHAQSQLSISACCHKLTFKRTYKVHFLHTCAGDFTGPGLSRTSLLHFLFSAFFFFFKLNRVLWIIRRRFAIAVERLTSLCLMACMIDITSSNFTCLFVWLRKWPY